MKLLHKIIPVAGIGVFVVGIGCMEYRMGRNAGYQKAVNDVVAAALESAKTATTPWKPKIGAQVATIMQLDGSIGDLRIVTITNVVTMGNDYCQSGVLVYGDGLPGVDSSWVKPAP